MGGQTLSGFKVFRATAVMSQGWAVYCGFHGRAFHISKTEDFSRQVMTDDPQGTTHFGYQTVPEAEKAGMVHGVFTRVASKYDIMNDLM